MRLQVDGIVYGVLVAVVLVRVKASVEGLGLALRLWLEFVGCRA